MRGGFGLFYDLGYGDLGRVNVEFPDDRSSPVFGPVPFDLPSPAFHPPPFTTTIDSNTLGSPAHKKVESHGHEAQCFRLTGVSWRSCGARGGTVASRPPFNRDKGYLSLFPVVDARNVQEDCRYWRLSVHV